ncbi:hypothetical protein BSKO_12963 [Bryopsis sp. KO-2023]|nr:hypothetical protein BSKO_12963 [Bryopsis sp. KO-2023]
MDRPGRVPSRQCCPLIMPNIRLGAEYVPDKSKNVKAKRSDKPEDKFKRMHALREKAAKDRAFTKMHFPGLTKEQELLCDRLRERYGQPEVRSACSRPDNRPSGVKLTAVNTPNGKPRTKKSHGINSGQMKVHTVHFCASPPELSKAMQKQINEPADRSLKKFQTLRRRASPIGGINDRSRGDSSKRKAYEQAQAMLKQEVTLPPALMADDPEGVPQEDVQLQKLLKERHEEMERLTSAATAVNREENMGSTVISLEGDI